MSTAGPDPEEAPRGAEGTAKHRQYREFQRRQFARLFLTYLAPVILLTVYFLLQYNWIGEESRRLHLLSVAENQANTLDLFLSERRANLSNLIREFQQPSPPTTEKMARGLTRLKLDSDSFVDVGFFDSTGRQVAYAGPYPALENRDYSQEPWFQALRERHEGFIITDIYLGFRSEPHFTIAVSRVVDGRYCVLRATLDPQEIYSYVTTLKGSSEAVTYIVNRGGGYQLVPAQMGEAMDRSSIVPPTTPSSGTHVSGGRRASRLYAYSWLRMADWALIVQVHPGQATQLLSGGFRRILFISFCVTLTILCVIWVRAKKLVQVKERTDQATAQLEHAAKLASVGELAAGIAHEINNPLAVITEEAGLARDLINPEFDGQITLPEVVPILQRIEEAAFRCRDITGKLLQFVRKTEVDLRAHNVHELIDEVVDGLLGREMAVSNIKIIKDYTAAFSTVVTDKNQLQQVLLNLLNNAVDALGGPGRITVTTARHDNGFCVSVSDTGRGMTRDQLAKIFVPFFTTKEVGKGTGLGLSVSYGIVKSMGGRIDVQSTPGAGSTFTIALPIR